MGDGRRPRHAARALRFAIWTVPAIVLLAIAALTLRTLIRSGGAEPPAVANTTSSAPASTVPAADVEPMHRALHDLGEACARDPAVRSSPAVTDAVDVLLDFARRHPDGRFQIDDESGTSLSLLLVLRDELRSCAPSALPRVEALLPADLREPATNE